MFKLSLKLWGLLFCFLFILYLIVLFIAIITTSYLVAVLTVLFCFYMLLKNVGTFAMYPGCFGYIKADLQLSGSQRLAQSMAQAFGDVFGFVRACQSHRSQFLYRVFIVKHVDDVLLMLERFEGSLSSQKTNLLKIYQMLGEFFDSQERITRRDGSEINVKIRDFLWEPENIKNLVGADDFEPLKKLATAIGQRCQMQMEQISKILKGFSPPMDSGPIRQMIYKVYGEKLFEIRFGICSWNTRYNYSTYSVSTLCEKETIEVAVVHSKKDTQPSTDVMGGKQRKRSKAVLICLPNGAYLQYFIPENQYTNMYLGLGYEIIVWNYRGYGGSTGEPSLNKSMEDAEAVYEYCKQTLGMNIQVVHGYSIGGPPAVRLGLKNSPQVKVLITDRTFSNISKIAESISPWLAKLGQLVMHADSQIRVDDMFAKCRNKCKVLVWAENDEIIANSCSLKKAVMDNQIGAVLSRELAQFYQKRQERDSFGRGSMDQQHSLADRLDSDEEMEEELDDITRQSSIKEAIISPEEKLATLNNRISKASTRLLRQNIEQFGVILIELKKKDLHYRSKIEQKTKRSENISQADEQAKGYLDVFWNTFAEIDGGGSKGSDLQRYIEKCLSKTVRLYVQKPPTQDGSEENEDDGDEMQENLIEPDKCNELIFSRVESYIMGLLIYGCCYRGPNQLAQSTQRQEINEQESTFGNNNSYTVQKLTSILQQYEGPLRNHIGNNQLLDIMGNIREIMKFIKLYSQIIASKPERGWRANGVVLPTKSGHNGDLEGYELNYMRDLLVAHGQTAESEGM